MKSKGCTWHLPGDPGFNRIGQKRQSAVYKEHTLKGVRAAGGFRSTTHGNRKETALSPAGRRERGAMVIGARD